MTDAPATALLVYVDEKLVPPASADSSPSGSTISPAGLEGPQIHHLSGVDMHALVWVGIALVVFWAIMWIGLKIATGFIHLVVIIGLALVIWGLVKRGARAIT